MLNYLYLQSEFAICKSLVVKWDSSNSRHKNGDTLEARDSRYEAERKVVKAPVVEKADEESEFEFERGRLKKGNNVAVLIGTLFLDSVAYWE